MRLQQLLSSLNAHSLLQKGLEMWYLSHDPGIGLWSVLFIPFVCNLGVTVSSIQLSFCVGQKVPESGPWDTNGLCD